MVRVDPIADASLAACRDFKRFGTAIAAMIPMIATTISNSISEKPFSFFIDILLGVFCHSVIAAGSSGAAIPLVWKRWRARPIGAGRALETSTSKFNYWIGTPVAALVSTEEPLV